MILVALLLSIVFIVYATTRLKIHPFLTLLITAIAFGLGTGMEPSKIIESINQGFGGTLGNIGIVIILGVMIGAFLEHTGAAHRLAQMVLYVIGKKRVPMGMSLIGFIVSIPVFGDSGFIVLTPLNRGLTKKAGISFAVTAVALAIGLTASHVLVPPTPGPIATAGIIGADLGLVIFLGLIVGLLALIPGLIFATKVASKLYIDPNPDATVEETPKEIPSGIKSSLPIIVPILLIVLKSFNDYLGFIQSASLNSTIAFLGTPVIALMIGLALALLLPKKLNKDMLSESGWVGKALQEAAIILMITGAGGVFGKVLQNSALADTIGETLATANLGIFLPFIIAAAIKTAQGSSTVAMITTASIISPLLLQLGFDTEISKALAVLAIGAGAACVSHANDSFFWIVTRMTGMDVSAGYRYHTAATGVLSGSMILLIFVISLLIG